MLIKSSQTGKRLIKSLATPSEPIPSTPPTKLAPEPIQTALIETCAGFVENNTQQFRNLSPDETDALFKKLLLERLSIAPAKANKPKSKPKKKSSKFKIVASSSESESESD